MKLFCQILLLIISVIGFFGTLSTDFHGRTARQPYGFTGAVWTLILFAIGTVIYIGAGAFSEIIKLFG